MTSLDDFARARPGRLAVRSLKRTLVETDRYSATQVRRDGREMISFCYNDYLNLSHYPKVIEAAVAATERFAAAAAIAAPEIMETEPALVALPLQKARLFARALKLPAPASCVVPLILGEAEAALAASASLAEAGYLVTAIRPPTVPEGTARLRFTFTAGHDDAEVERIAKAVRGLVRAAA